MNKASEGQRIMLSPASKELLCQIFVASSSSFRRFCEKKKKQHQAVKVNKRAPLYPTWNLYRSTWTRQRRVSQKLIFLLFWYFFEMLKSFALRYFLAFSFLSLASTSTSFVFVHFTTSFERQKGAENWKILAKKRKVFRKNNETRAWIESQMNLQVFSLSF